MHCVSLDGILLFVLTHTSHSTAPYASIGRSRSLGSRTRRDEENITLRYANQFHSICIRSVTSTNYVASHGLHGSKNKSKKRSVARQFRSLEFACDGKCKVCDLQVLISQPCRVQDDDASPGYARSKIETGTRAETKK